MLGLFAAVAAHGPPITRLGRRSIAIMACLAVDPDSVWTRDRLALLLWGRRRIEQGRTSLRQEIVRLRQALGRNPIAQDTVGGALRLRCDDFAIDVVEFRSALADPERRADAATLYRGELLEGIACDRDLEPFAEWLATHRRRLKNEALRCYMQLLRSSIARTDAAEATRLAERALAIEPACEEAHQSLIRAHAARHDLHAVLEQFRACREALRAQHRMEPSPETSRLVELFKVTLRAEPQPDSVLASAQAEGWAPRAQKGLAPSPRGASSYTSAEHGTTVAVLPFIDLSTGHRDESLVDGLTDETIAALTKMPGILVTARSSVMAYKGAAMDVRQIATELGVNFVLESSIRRDRRHIRVNIRLIDGQTGLHVWAESLETPASDLMSVRDTFIPKSVVRLQSRLRIAGPTNPRSSANAYEPQR
jgi:TolB-like protein/DNA-binding SARP family transcriptional activator